MAFGQSGCCSKLACLHLAPSHWLWNASLCQNLVGKQHMPLICCKSVAKRKTLWGQLHAPPASSPSFSFTLTWIFTHTLPLFCMHVLRLFHSMLQLSQHAVSQTVQSSCATAESQSYWCSARSRTILAHAILQHCLTPTLPGLASVYYLLLISLCYLNHF